MHMIFEHPTVMPNVRYATSFAEFTDFNVWKEYIEEDSIFDLPKQERTALVFRPDETLVRSIMQAFLWEYPYAGHENLPVKSSATALLENGEITRLRLGDEAEEESVEMQAEENGRATTTGLEAGLAYHAFLEEFDFSRLYAENGAPIEKTHLKELIEDTYEKVKDKEALALLSSEKLEDILSNPVFYSLFGMRLYKEQQFLVSLPIKDTYAKRADVLENLSESEEEMIFQGAIDLLAVDKDGAWIIDYKYSTKNADELKAHYKPQLELYKRATAKILHMPIENIRCSIVNIYKGFQTDFD